MLFGGCFYTPCGGPESVVAGNRGVQLLLLNEDCPNLCFFCFVIERNMFYCVMKTG